MGCTVLPSRLIFAPFRTIRSWKSPFLSLKFRPLRILALVVRLVNLLPEQALFTVIGTHPLRYLLCKIPARFDPQCRLAGLGPKGPVRLWT
jgi:hypothetical protein